MRAGRAILSGAGARGPQSALLRRLAVHDDPAQDGAPEVREPVGVVAVEGDLGQSGGHASIQARRIPIGMLDRRLPSVSAGEGVRATAKGSVVV